MKKLFSSHEERLARRRQLRKLKPKEWHDNNARLNKESVERHRAEINQRKTEYRKRTTVNGVSKEKQYCIDHPEKYLWWAARNRAKRDSVEFDIEESDIIIPEFCPILKVRLISVRQTRQNRDWVPSVDRLDNSKGYIKGNIRVISFKANRYKTDMTIDNLENLLLYCKGLI